jgi:hypothetical protein
MNKQLAQPQQVPHLIEKNNLKIMIHTTNEQKLDSN